MAVAETIKCLPSWLTSLSLTLNPLTDQSGLNHDSLYAKCIIHASKVYNLLSAGLLFPV